MSASASVLLIAGSRSRWPVPRSRGDAAFAAIEKRILDRVLQKPGSANDQPDAAGHYWQGLRWAV